MVKTHALEDGSWLIVRAANGEAGEREERDERSGDVLGPVHDFVIGALVGGAAGNLTYDVLKASLVNLIGRGVAEERTPADAAEVTALIEEFMRNAGYGPVE